MSIGIGLPLHIVSSSGSSKGLQPCDTHQDRRDGRVDEGVGLENR